ncbi:hypothetical protein BDV93DRAFT_554107 [Ceratobasidium sp. AG-I]|nr:hypothetical protein BDV93DRAFT_554107 [Ceratobasidium sp. AG-I]
MEAGGYAFWAGSNSCMAKSAATPIACGDCQRVRASSKLQSIKDRCTSNSSRSTNRQYLRVAQIQGQLQECNDTIQQLRFEQLKNTSKISTLTNPATQHQLLMTTISMNDVAGLSRLICAVVESNVGPWEIVRHIQMAADGLYSVKSFSLLLEPRGCYDGVTDSLVGISRETTGKLNLSNISINPIEKLEQVGAAIASGECRLAKEVTMLAFASFSEVNYQAQAVLASGTDKTELKPEQTQLVQLAIDSWNESPHG